MNGVTSPQVLSPEERARLLRFMRRHRVVLHNDQVNYVRRAAEILTQEIGLRWQDAWRILLEANVKGQATIMLCAREQAERYCWRLKVRGLTSSVEEA